jgi:hypothetical protein
MADMVVVANDGQAILMNFREIIKSSLLQIVSCEIGQIKSKFFGYKTFIKL